MAKTKTQRPAAAGLAKTPAGRRGRRLRILREALGYTPSSFAKRSQQVADFLVNMVSAGLGTGGYAAVDASQLLHMEAGRHHIGKAATRAVLGGVFGLTQDDLGYYLDGRIHLEEATALAESRRSAAAAEATL